jgi:hypothetical protein
MGLCSTTRLHFDFVEPKNFDVFFRERKADSRGGHECIVYTRLPEHESNAAIAEKDIKIKKAPGGGKSPGASACNIGGGGR